MNQTALRGSDQSTLLDRHPQEVAQHLVLGHGGNIFRWNTNSMLFITTKVEMKPKPPTTQNELSKTQVGRLENIKIRGRQRLHSALCLSNWPFQLAPPTTSQAPSSSKSQPKNPKTCSRQSSHPSTPSSTFVHSHTSLFSSF